MSQQNLCEFENNAIKNGYSNIAGIDEAGRGPLAGPVVSAAVIFKASYYEEAIQLGIKDSKRLTPKKRDTLYDIIYENAVAIGVGLVNPQDIDRINILQAALLSMAQAVEDLIAKNTVKPGLLFVDGIYQIKSLIPQQIIKRGDQHSVTIGAASIIAKVTRDRKMKEYDKKYPGYGFEKHKGYPTREHKEAIRQLGPSPIHRKTFKGVKEFV